MAKAKKPESIPETVAPVAALDEKPKMNGELVAQIAYEKMRVELAGEGTFPAWFDLSQATHTLYERAADHCQHADPRTRYEEIVLEVLNG